MTRFLSDLQRGARTLRRTPAFTLLAVGMLALGLGATTAMFSVVDVLWLRPLPYNEPDRLVVLEEGVPKFARISSRLPVNAHDADMWRAQSRTFDGITLFQTGGSALISDGPGAPTVAQEYVSAEFFSVLGIRPQLGRLFEAGDDTAGHNQIAVLSDGLWRRAFNADPAVVGRRVHIGGRAVDIVGVLGPGVRTPRPSQVQTMAFGTDAGVDLWRPLLIDPQLREVRMSEFDYAAIGRMRPGVTVDEAHADLEAIERRIATEVGGGAEVHAILTPLAIQAGTPSQDAVMMLTAAVTVVLVIVCVNLSNAFLSRATGRQKQLAIQAALGATRGRLIREALAESLIVSGAGAVLGLMLAEWILHGVLAAAPLSLPDWRAPGIDLRVVAFVVVSTLLLSATLAALPAWRSSAADPQDALRTSDRGSTDGPRGRSIRRSLVGAEVALSTTALVVAALLASSFLRLMAVDVGFEQQGGFVMGLALGGPSAPDEKTGVVLTRDVMARIAALPGVKSVGVVNRLPLTGEGGNLGVYVEGSVSPDEHPVADYRTVSAGYFAAMGIPLVSGRLISDQEGDHRVGLVSVSTAARLWPGESPIGRHIRFGAATNDAYEIIGIVGDVRAVSLLKAPNLTIYLPFWQFFRPGLAVAVRAAGDPAALIDPVRRIVQQAVPDRPAPTVRRLDELVSGTVAARRFQLNVVLGFATVGLLLAAMGIYTVIAQTMARRTRELGIRIALGAAQADVWRLVGQEGLTPVVIGLVAGLAMATAAARLVRSMLVGLTAYDGPTYAIVAGVILATAAAACAWPARRAGRIDPLTALRES